MRYILFPFGVLVALGFTAWCSDFITLQGERTVYSVRCDGGNWSGRTCIGHLRPGNRYRFRALKAHKEVLYWTAGEAAQSGKFSDCDITSGRIWKCRPQPGHVNTVTYEMSAGGPVLNPSWNVDRVHTVPKWRWYLLLWGMPAGSVADD